MKARIILAVLFFASTTVRAEHPEVLTTPADHDTMVAKVRDVDWARASYEKLKANVDRCMALAHDDPEWLSSRLAMNWKTHYTTAICRNSACVGGEGHADVPTPRFGGARNWATPNSPPDDIADFIPYNDNEQGQIRIGDKWVAPADTGRTIELMNERVMKLATDASFVYWITGDQRYARFGAEALWTYMQGFDSVTPPKLPEGDRSMAGVIGSTSFEVIHEDIVTPLAVSYDFLYDELKRQGKDVNVIQSGLKRMIDRVIAGGSRSSNWNLNQARIIAYGGIALEEDSAYEDHHGRSYYINVVLKADLPAQQGISQVIQHSFEPTTALWPEAGGYGFGSAKDITLIATLVGNSPEGAEVLRDPILVRNAFSQGNFTYPNGLACGLGDTVDTTVNAELLELLITAARNRGDEETELKLTSLLNRCLQTSHLPRGAEQDTLIALTKDVASLKPAPALEPLDRTFFAKPLNALVQRNVVDDPNASLAASMYGTAGGHVHVNGLAIELYGAGLTMGADPGRGESYWTEDHTQYNLQPPAHNTVIVDAKSTYPVNGQARQSMTLDHAEPESETPALSPNVSYATASFKYVSPVAAHQERTLAVIRTGPASGCYVDIFRSKADTASADEFHDYLYHNIGQSVQVNGDGKPLELATTDSLMTPGALPGYKYFENEKSAAFAGELHDRFDVARSDGDRAMNLWMAPQDGRTIFAVDAPTDHATRVKEPKPMPCVIARHQGPTWDEPFIAVFEPAMGKNASAIARVQRMKTDAIGLVACTIDERDGSTICVVEDTQADRKRADLAGISFAGHFGIAIRKGDAVSELYLGDGRTIGDKTVRIEADQPVNATLYRVGSSWHYSSSGPIHLHLSSGGSDHTVELKSARDQVVD
jgi:hypothetical protein